MRRVIELYGAWILGVLSTCALGYPYYRQIVNTQNAQAETQTEIVNTVDTVDTDSNNSGPQVRARFLD